MTPNLSDLYSRQLKQYNTAQSDKLENEHIQTCTFMQTNCNEKDHIIKA